MQSHHSSNAPEFLSDVYRGRPIAILHRYGRWHVYLDYKLQHDVMFDRAENAIAWLTKRIDQSVTLNGRLDIGPEPIGLSTVSGLQAYAQ